MNDAIHFRRVGFDAIQHGEYFMYKDGDPYVKIKVQRPKQLTPKERERLRKKATTWREENPLELFSAGLNLRTMETNYDITGNDLACCRIKGVVHVEAYDPCS